MRKSLSPINWKGHKYFQSDMSIPGAWLVNASNNRLSWPQCPKETLNVVEACNGGRSGYFTSSPESHLLIRIFHPSGVRYPSGRDAQQWELGWAKSLQDLQGAYETRVRSRVEGLRMQRVLKWPCYPRQVSLELGPISTGIAEDSRILPNIAQKRSIVKDRELMHYLYIL